MTIKKNNKEFIKEYKHYLEFSQGLSFFKQMQNEYRQKHLFYLRLRYFTNKFYSFKLLAIGLSHVFHKLSFHSSRFVYYITNIIKKIRKFYKEKDPEFDHVLAQYLYSNEELYKEFNALVEKEDFQDITNFKLFNQEQEISQILYHKEAIINFINFDYVIDPIRVSTEKYIMRIYKRIHILLVLAILNIYIVYNNKYTLICYNIEISLYLITILVLCILYLIHRNIAEETPEKWLENKNTKIYFYILLIILYLFLKNKVDSNMVEILLNFKDIFIIKENFTLEEKYNYIFNYLNKFNNNEMYNKKILENMMLYYKENPEVLLHMNLEDIKNNIKEIYNNMISLEKLNNIHKSTFMEKIFSLFKNKS